MNRVVLVLNTNYAPLSICTAKRAICLQVLEKVEVLDVYDEVAHSPSTTIPLPSVVKLKEFVHYNSIVVALSRKNILTRDDHACQYCGTRHGVLTVDHIIPRERGGMDTWENLVTACAECNLKKGNHTPEEVNMPLLKKPSRPNRIHYFQQFVKQKQSGWRPFLFMEPFQPADFS